MLSSTNTMDTCGIQEPRSSKAVVCAFSNKPPAWSTSSLSRERRSLGGQGGKFPLVLGYYKGCHIVNQGYPAGWRELGSIGTGRYI